MNITRYDFIDGTYGHKDFVEMDDGYYVAYKDLEKYKILFSDCVNKYDSVVSEYDKFVDDFIVIKMQNADLSAQLEAVKGELEEFRTGYTNLFNSRAGRVEDLQNKVRLSLDKSSCPPAFMDIASEAILFNGCGEIADLKKANELLESRISEANAKIAESQKQESVAYAFYTAAGDIRIWWSAKAYDIYSAKDWASANRVDYSDLVSLYAQPVIADKQVAVPDGWEMEIYNAMDNAFKLGKYEDGGMVNDDTQIGVEFAMEYFKRWLSAAPSEVK